MKSPREIKKRIEAVRKIHKLTKTMEMVAMTRIIRASNIYNYAKHQAAIISYALQHTLLSKLGLIISRSNLPDEILNTIYPNSNYPNRIIVVLTSNRGLCGAYNTNIFRELRTTLREFSKEDQNVKNYIYALGRKGITYFKFYGQEFEVIGSNTKIVEKPSFQDAKNLILDLLNERHKFKASEIWLIHTIAKTVISFRPTHTKLVPFIGFQDMERVKALEEDELVKAMIPLTKDLKDILKKYDIATLPLNMYSYIIEPDPENMIRSLIIDYLALKMYYYLAQAMLAEHNLRRMAMHQAAESASDMIVRLRRQYNRARQYKITKELSEIMGAVEALK